MNLHDVKDDIPQEVKRIAAAWRAIHNRDYPLRWSRTDNRIEYSVGHWVELRTQSRIDWSQDAMLEGRVRPPFADDMIEVLP